MSLAGDLNRGFTLAAMNPQRVVRKGSSVGKSEMRGETLHVKVPEVTEDLLRACTLEHQQGQYRAFRLIDGQLVHSHVLKVECVRRAERDGYAFTMRPA